ncbi:MAG: hypothetical protein JHC93_07525, partial [Parachlamydiales bacterium]|nr:hypothetical protein [Parachlamydiales bacterium]
DAHNFEVADEPTEDEVSYVINLLDDPIDTPDELEQRLNSLFNSSSLTKQQKNTLHILVEERLNELIR